MFPMPHLLLLTMLTQAMFTMFTSSLCIDEQFLPKLQHCLGETLQLRVPRELTASAHL